jgi:carboxymethylenebutenolidase
MAEQRGEMVQVPVNGRQAAGYLVRPDGGGQGAPGVVVIQEWWGLVDHIKDVADRFAAEGFVALAPDLYHGQQTDEPDDARKLAMEMDRAAALADLEASTRYLRSLGCPRVGAVGFCMGGGLVLELATRPNAIDAAAPYYGRPLPPERAGEVQAPVLGLYGEKDSGIPVAGVNALAESRRAPGEGAALQVERGGAPP